MYNSVVLQTPGSMEQNVFVQIQETDVYLGNFLMETNAFISKTLVQKELDGMEKCALHLEETVQTVSTKIKLNANHSLKDVFLQQFGETEDVLPLVETVLLELYLEVILVNLIADVKEVKHGILTLSNAFVQKELDGMEENVSFVVEIKFGIHMTDVLALKVLS